MRWKPPNLGITSITSEAVSPGHPNKLADTVADAVLDACLGQDRSSRVACHVTITDRQVLVAGEIASRHRVEDHLSDLFTTVANDAGYRDPIWGFDVGNCDVQATLNQDTVPSSGTTNQGVVFGYACAENRELLPLPVLLSQRLMQCHAAVVRSHKLPWLGPAAQTQVSVIYQDNRARAIDRVVFIAQHQENVSLEQMHDEVMQNIIAPILPVSLCDLKTQYRINPAGPNTLGGPAIHTGHSGHGSPVDTYGSTCPQGGGFSGKDPTHSARCGAYMARYLAKHIVGAGIACRCTVQLVYAPGSIEPVSVFLDTHDSSPLDPDRLTTLIKEQFDLSIPGIIRSLSLDRPIYRPTATFGHFGHLDAGYTWERLDRVTELRRVCNLTSNVSQR
ncbi:methionine adenosyltransferase [Planctomycetota bacterium]